MHSLEQALLQHELLVLRVIGEWWEMELAGEDKIACAKALAERLTQLDLSAEMDFLPPEDAAALSDLVEHKGRIPVATFSRKHGEVRMMGPGRLEREEPWLDPISASEALWYRGFLYRGFDEAAEGMIEYYYLPQELLRTFPQANEVESSKVPHVPTAKPAPDLDAVNAAATDAVDDVAALLALAQRGLITGDELVPTGFLLNPDKDRQSLLLTLAHEEGLLRLTNGELRPTREAVNWLKESRESELRTLADAWSRSGWNELCHTPGIACQGEGWQNDPILARTALLETLPRSDEWFAIDDVVEQIKLADPDFQRPDGNYDTWYIRDAISEAYLTGFESWDKVEGRLIRFLLEAPCYWFGMVETSGSAAGSLYRLTSRALDWLANRPPTADSLKVPIVVQPDGNLLVPYNADRYHRFQVARVSEAAPARPGQPYRYRLTPTSLAQAQDQGIDAERILRFLEEASGRALPTGFRRAVVRWSQKGIEARVESTVILRVRDVAILDTLRSNPKTRNYLGESLGELVVGVREGDWPHLVEAACQLGLLLDASVEV